MFHHLFRSTLKTQPPETSFKSYALLTCSSVFDFSPIENIQSDYRTHVCVPKETRILFFVVVGMNKLENAQRLGFVVELQQYDFSAATSKAQEQPTSECSNVLRIKSINTDTRSVCGSTASLAAQRQQHWQSRSQQYQASQDGQQHTRSPGLWLVVGLEISGVVTACDASILRVTTISSQVMMYSTKPGSAAVVWSWAMTVGSSTGTYPQPQLLVRGIPIGGWEVGVMAACPGSLSRCTPTALKNCCGVERVSDVWKLAAIQEVSGING